MSDWTLWASFIALGAGGAILATYLLCKARIQQTHHRVVILEREIALARLREEANEKKLSKIFDAVTALRESTEEHLRNVRDKLDDLRQRIELV